MFSGAQDFLLELLDTCRGLGMGVPDMQQRGIPEELIIHMDQSESVGILLDRAAHAAREFFKKPPQLLFVCMNTRGAAFHSRLTWPHLSMHCGRHT